MSGMQCQVESRQVGKGRTSTFIESSGWTSVGHCNIINTNRLRTHLIWLCVGFTS
jgi:hypothetical protein